MNFTRLLSGMGLLFLLCSCGPSIGTGAGAQELTPAVEIPTAQPSSEGPPTPDPSEPSDSAVAALRRADAPRRADATPPPPPDNSGPRAAAQATFEHARELMSQGKFAEACAKFQESFGLDPAIGSLLNLAVCEEKLGRIDRACSAFGEAAIMAARVGQPEREAVARQRMTNLGCPP
jgi:TolA-binding protein